MMQNCVSSKSNENLLVSCVRRNQGNCETIQMKGIHQPMLIMTLLATAVLSCAQDAWAKDAVPVDITPNNMDQHSAYLSGIDLLVQPQPEEVGYFIKVRTGSLASVKVAAQLLIFSKDGVSRSMFHLKSDEVIEEGCVSIIGRINRELYESSMIRISIIDGRDGSNHRLIYDINLKDFKPR